MYHKQSNSFPMFFSVGNGYRGYDEGKMYSFASSSPSALVDCILSLGRPSTRVTGESGSGGGHHQQEKKRSSCMSKFGWNILLSKHTQSSSAAKPHRGAGNGGAGSGGDPLLARRCGNCDTTSTPLWRNSPRGPKSLCNPCGIRYKKEERRAMVAAATSHGSNGGSGNEMMNGGWGQAQKSTCYSSFGPGYGSEYRFMEDEAADHHHHRETEIPFMLWRFNITDRPGLVHDFIR